jgi:heat shock protein HslJ
MIGRLSLVLLVAALWHFPIGCWPAVRAAGQPSAALSGRWYLELMQNGRGPSRTPPNRDAYVLEFRARGALSVRADCNRGAGEYLVTANRLSITLTRMTRARCAAGSLFDVFVALVEGTTAFQVEGDRLRLTVSTSTSATFTRASLVSPVQTAPDLR